MSFEWWREAVIYQIYPRSFMDSNGDGVGDLQGIISHLDYLNDGTDQSLGIDAIWLSPVYPSPMYDFGYDISDYENIDPVFGDMETFRHLLKEAHARNIRIIMDLVVNHTSHEHPWFVESRSSRESPMRDWYIWKDPVNGKEPNNWLATFGGKAWEWDEKTGQYYYHAFLAEQPDLNWRNPEVKEAIFHMIENWLKIGVDGFRLDVVNLFFKDAEFKDNPEVFALKRAYDRQRHNYDRNQPEMHGVLKDLRKLLDSYGDKMSVGEVMMQWGDDSDLPASFQGKNDELHMTFNFAFFFSEWKAEKFREVITHWTEALGDNWPTYTLSNHDFTRHITRYKAGKLTDARARIALLMLLTLRGTPFLYYGEEIGMHDETVGRARIQDPLGKRYWPLYSGRDACRKPMCWTGSKEGNGGFSTGEPWLPVYSRLEETNVEAQRDNPAGMLTYYRVVLRLRRQSDVLRRGDQTMLMDAPDGVLAYTREYQGKRLLIALNFENRPAVLEGDSFAPFEGGEVLFSSTDEIESHRSRNQELKLHKLGPLEGVIIEQA